VIVSASRRTDIPAFYVPWLAHRLQAGFCEVANPFRPRQVSRVSLRPEDVDAIVFWTRHARPLLDLLPELDRRGFRSCVQYTITGYGAPLERRTPPLETAIDTFCALADRLPPGAVVWRYDPILVGDAFPAASHRERFARIARGLEGRSRRVVVSLLDVYAKTRRRTGRLLRWGTDVVEDAYAWPGLEALLVDLVAIAADHGFEIEACAEARDLTPLGIAPTKCVDDRLLAGLYGGAWPARKDPGQREACRCIPSRDIGAPDTCVFGCAYCYATRSDEAARARHAAHDPRAPSLSQASSTSR